MATTTIYDIKVRYQVDSKSMASMKQLDSTLRRLDTTGSRTARSANTLTSSFRGLVATAAGFFTFRAAKSALVDYNSEIELAKIQIAGLMEGARGGTFEQNTKLATGLVEELQERAKASTATTAEMVSFLSNTVGPLSNAGLAAKDMAEFTAQAVVAAKAFGDEGVAQFDIQQALNSQVTMRDRFTKKLLEMNKVDVELFNKKSKAERLAILQQALRHRAIADMAKAQENSFAGVTSTLKDNLQILLATAGQPVFKVITEEIKSWNVWLEKNKDVVAQWATDFGAKLKEAFGFAKKMVGFLVEHKDTLIMLAKGFLAFKAANAMVSGAQGIGNILQGIATNGMGAANALGLVAAAAIMLADKIDRDQEKHIQKQVEFNSMKRFLDRANDPKNALRGGSARAGIKDLTAAGILKGGKVDEARLKSFILEANRGKFAMDPGGIMLQKETNEWLKMIANAQAIDSSANAKAFAQAFDTAISDAMNGLYTNMVMGPFNAALENGPTAGPPKIDVTIRNIEVQSDDPDRFVFQLAQTVSNAVRSGGSARGVMRE